MAGVLSGRGTPLLCRRRSRPDIAEVRAALDTLAKLAPDDPAAARWREALDGGRLDPADPALVRLMMNESLRSNRLADAAAAAAQRVAQLPHDWQSRCVLAHDALTRGKRDEARQHLAVLPSPFDLETGLGPGPLLYALQLRRELG